MCGIVGYLGSKNAISIVLEGLKRLEYRGYDSAGICFKNPDGRLSLYKKSGKLQNLVDHLHEEFEGQKETSHSCIGHTRWATHGGVCDANAHPHLSDSISIDDDNSIAIVHNGIIENSNQLKEQLISKGIKFNSETDSEVFLGLLVIELNSGCDFFKAVTNAFKQIDGNSAFLIQIKGKNEILAIKRGAPLVCGMTEEDLDFYVSSDPYALAGMAQKIYFPEDEVICSLKEGEEEPIFYELNGKESHRYQVKDQELEASATEKGEYEHYMLKEIHEQPHLIRSLIGFYLKDHGIELLDKAGKYRPGGVHIIACGTAWHAGLLIAQHIEKNNEVPCKVELASEFRYRNPILKDDEMTVFISQSGETADTLAAQQLCKERGLPTLSVVNVEGSTLYRNCDDNFLIKAGVEIGVASTKAFTLQVLTGQLVSMRVGNKFNENDIMERYNLLANRVEEILENTDPIKEIAEEIYNQKGFIFTGRGQYFPIALEGALKLKEIAYVHAEGYPAGELKHGPIALIDEEMVNIAIVGPELYEKTISNIQEVKARKGIILTIGPQNDKELQEISTHYIPLNFDGLGDLSPLYVNVVTQLLSYYMAHFKGTDIDKPRNLAKSVTVE